MKRWLIARVWDRYCILEAERRKLFWVRILQWYQRRRFSKYTIWIKAIYPMVRSNWLQFSDRIWQPLVLQVSPITAIPLLGVDIWLTLVLMSDLTAWCAAGQPSCGNNTTVTNGEVLEEDWRPRLYKCKSLSDRSFGMSRKYSLLFPGKVMRAYYKNLWTS